MSRPDETPRPGPGPQPEPLGYPFAEATALADAIDELSSVLGNVKRARIDAYAQANVDFEGAAHERFTEAFWDRVTDLDGMVHRLDGQYWDVREDANRARAHSSERDEQIQRWHLVRAQWDAEQAAKVPD